MRRGSLESLGLAGGRRPLVSPRSDQDGPPFAFRTLHRAFRNAETFRNDDKMMTKHAKSL